MEELYFGISIVLFVITILVAIKNRRNIAVMVRILAVGIVLTNIIMLIPITKDNHILSLFDALQIGSLNADYNDLLGKLISKKNYYYVFCIVLCVLSPLIFCGFILTLFEKVNDRIKYILFNKNSDTYIFSELNNNSLMLAESIYNANKKSLIIFCNSNLIENESIVSSASSKGFLLLAENEAHFICNRFKESYFFEINNNQDEVLAHTQNLLKAFIDKNKINLLKNNVYVFSEQNEAGIALSSIDKKGLNVVLINRNRAVAYNLLFKEPLFLALSSKEKQLSILVVGSGSIGHELIKACAWCGQLGFEYKLQINIVDKNISWYKKFLQKECPELFNGQYDLKFYEADVQTEDFEQILIKHCKKINYIITTLGNDGLNIKTALYLRSFYLRTSADFSYEPIIAVQITDKTKNAYAKEFTAIDRERINHRGWKINSLSAQNYNLVPFGSNDSIYSYNFIIDSETEKLAINSHAVYELMFTSNKATESDIRKNYGLNELNRRSNQANAIHIIYKLFIFGYEIKKIENATEKEIEESKKLSTELKEKFMNKTIIEKLSRLEHERWNAFMRTEGWHGATVKNVEKYIYQTEGSHKFSRAKLHACICPWKELDDVVEKYDKHIKEYDQMFITKIDSILGLDGSNRINISNMKYILVKK